MTIRFRTGRTYECADGYVYKILNITYHTVDGKPRARAWLQRGGYALSLVDRYIEESNEVEYIDMNLGRGKKETCFILSTNHCPEVIREESLTEVYCIDPDVLPIDRPFIGALKSYFSAWMGLKCDKCSIYHIEGKDYPAEAFVEF
jgi:hypothetical protein